MLTADLGAVSAPAWAQGHDEDDDLDHHLDQEQKSPEERKGLRQMCGVAGCLIRMVVCTLLSSLTFYASKLFAC